MLENLWKDNDLTGIDQLVYRANILGQNPSVTNWKGGNISMKQVEKDFDGREVRVLRVKGSGSDLRTAKRDDFVGLRLDPILQLYSRSEMSDEDMVKYLTHCIVDNPSKRQSIETLMHSFLPFEHIDHTHADYILWFAALEGGRKIAEDIYGSEMVWVDYHRPGFHLAKTVAEAVKKNPKAKCVILAKHGFLSWGKTSKECYLTTLSLLKKAEDYVTKKMARTQVRIEANRHEVVASFLPKLRGALSQSMVLHYDDSEPVMEFLSRPDAKELAMVGAACPDHLVSTKRVPMFGSPEQVLSGMEAYRKEYEAYFNRSKTNESMDDPSPRVILMPGLGMVTTGKNKETAVATSWLYHRAITVMKGASALGKFVSLNEQESFGIEYWPLERYKLTQMPPDKELTGKVALVTGGASGIGRAAAERLMAEGAQVVCADLNESDLKGALNVKMDVTDEKSVLEAFRRAVMEYGGVDILVSSAGIAKAAPIEETTLADWNRLHSILTTGYFLVAREAFKIMKTQGKGGSIIFVVSKNALTAGKNNVAYSAAKAAELHIARCIAEEGGAHGIRSNVVNPDAVLARSSIWNSEWRAARAKDYGIKPEELEEFYRKRTTLKVNIFAEDVAEAIYFFASNKSSKLTGNILNVDGGVPGAYPR
jgi:rhamnulose-1-phosphate aldolase/alcohol dehydrogenase